MRASARHPPPHENDQGKREESEWQAEEEPDVGRAHGAESSGQALLGGIPERLRGRPDQREGNPQPPAARRFAEGPSAVRRVFGAGRLVRGSHHSRKPARGRLSSALSDRRRATAPGRWRRHGKNAEG